jgi:hypothetical protein
MRLFSHLVYISVIARVWLHAFNVPVAHAASWTLLALFIVCIVGDMYVWTENRQKFVETMAKVIEAQVGKGK